ncbi:AEC family transporter [Proteiniborus sp.]|uniref:AEC family transporter n=1 Tax=Proteiniborus sp. TaxID=2079015 RepID=UPI003328B2EA
MVAGASSILSILLIIAVGFIISKIGWLENKTGDVFSKIIINISLPSLMITNISQRFSNNTLVQYKYGIIISFACILISYLISYIIGKVTKIDKVKLGLFCALFTFSNTIFIGLPVNIAIYGEDSIPFVLLYYFANTTLFWTLGVYNIKKTKYNKKVKLSINMAIKKILSPPLLGFIIGLIIVLLNIQLPIFIADGLKHIGNLTTPLSMFFIGLVISSVKLQNIKFDLYSCLIIIGKFFITPFIVFMFLHFFDFPALMKNVFILEASMPIMAQIAVVAKHYENNSEYTSWLITFTTIISIIIVPFFAVLLV